MLTRHAILLAWALSVLVGSLVVALVMQGVDAFLVGLGVSTGASLPYLGVFLLVAPARRSVAVEQALHFVLSLATLLALLPWMGGFALFTIPYYLLGVVLQLLLRARPLPDEPGAEPDDRPDVAAQISPGS